MMESFDRYIEQQQETFIEELERFCAQPSIAATGEGVAEMAGLVREKMAALGAEVKMLEVTPGGPEVVYATLGGGDRKSVV